MTFKELETGDIFRYEGSDYMKYKGANGHKCFQVAGFASNNRPDEVKDNTKVEKIANSLKEFAG